MGLLLLIAVAVLASGSSSGPVPSSGASSAPPASTNTRGGGTTAVQAALWSPVPYNGGAAKSSTRAGVVMPSEQEALGAQVSPAVAEAFTAGNTYTGGLGGKVDIDPVGGNS